MGETRAERLKAALRANLKRRKAQPRSPRPEPDAERDERPPPDPERR